MKIFIPTTIVMIAFIGAVTIGPSFRGAAVFAGESCEKLYADYLQKAKQALVDKKPDDAIAYLLKASAVAESCANLVRPSDGQTAQKTVV